MIDKEQHWEAYWQGVKQGYGVEEMKSIDKRAARTQFEKWWKRNAGEE